jgi:hypothetical protein
MNNEIHFHNDIEDIKNKFTKIFKMRDEITTSSKMVAIQKSPNFTFNYKDAFLR